VYCSEQAHSSIDKAVMAIGLGHESLRKITVDDQYRMIAEALGAAIVEDRAAGWLPIAVVATVGTTSTTSIDPVPVIADVCARERLWLHVDAAYAGVAAMLPHAHILDGATAPTRVADPTSGCSRRSICPRSTAGDGYDPRRDR
jgi:aromatic-L-amino-acid decarboxylase